MRIFLKLLFVVLMLVNLPFIVAGFVVDMAIMSFRIGRSISESLAQL